MDRPAHGRPLLLEAADLLPEDERAGAQHAVEGRAQLARQLGVFAVEGNEGDRLLRHERRITAPGTSCPTQMSAICELLPIYASAGLRTATPTARGASGGDGQLA